MFRASPTLLCTPVTGAFAWTASGVIFSLKAVTAMFAFATLKVRCTLRLIMSNVNATGRFDLLRLHTGDRRHRCRVVRVFRSPVRRPSVRLDRSHRVRQRSPAFARQLWRRFRTSTPATENVRVDFSDYKPRLPPRENSIRGKINEQVACRWRYVPATGYTSIKRCKFQLDSFRVEAAP